MNREIKFRGKSVKSGEWVYGCYCRIGGGIVCILPFDTGIVIDSRGQYVKRMDFIEVIPETVGEYTGLKDSKRTEEYPEGQEIYKGDYVHIWSDFYKKDMPKAEVFWNNRNARFDIKSPNGLYHDWLSNGHCQGWFIEVIGTIHDEE